MSNQAGSNQAGADRPATISFQCAKCGQKLTASVQRAGQRGSCPKCKSPIEVPASPASAGVSAATLTDSPLSVPAPPPSPTLPATPPELPERIAGGGTSVGEEAPPVAPMAAAEVSAENSVEMEAIPAWLRGAERDDSPFIYVDETSRGGARAEPPIVDGSHLTVPRYVVFAQGIALGLVALVAFALGMLAGGTGTGSSADGGGTGGSAEFRGTIEYRTSGGTTFPDGGAVVLAFPQSSRPETEERVTVAGLRPSDPSLPPVTEQKLKQMGAVVARADAQGMFRATAPRGGKYFVLVISHHGVRAANREPARADIAALGRYVDAPDQLLGDRRYRWRVADLRGVVDLSVVLD